MRAEFEIEIRPGSEAADFAGRIRAGGASRLPIASSLPGACGVDRLNAPAADQPITCAA
jgi:hypothetical protein